LQLGKDIILKSFNRKEHKEGAKFAKKNQELTQRSKFVHIVTPLYEVERGGGESSRKRDAADQEIT